MSNITVIFQNLTFDNSSMLVGSVPSGQQWIANSAPISGWPGGTNPSGAAFLPVSGASGYNARVFPSASGKTFSVNFSEDATVTLAVFNTDSD